MRQADSPASTGWYFHVLIMLLAVGLLALGTPVIKLLVQRGGRFGEAAPLALTFCNVLLVGNLAAAVLSLLIFGPRKIFRQLQQSPRPAWGWMLGSGALAVLVPGFLYAALETVPVTDIVLISRLGLIVQGLLAYVFFRTRIHKGEAIGYILIFLGALFLVWTGQMFMVHRGELFLLLATAFHAGAVMVAHRTLSRISLGLFLFTRNLFSAFFFFGVGTWLFGLHHFAHAFAGPLWGLMLLYAGLVILLGQGLWFRYARQASPDVQRRISYLEPLFTLLYAFFLLGEVPRFWDLMAILLVLGGMAVVHFHPKAQLSALQEPPNVTGR